MRKLGLYLGLVEDDENEAYDRYDDEADEGYDEPVVRRREPAPTAVTRRSFEAPRTPGSVALDTAPRPQAVASYDEGYRITTLHPHS
jgi:hypothetical protein